MQEKELKEQIFDTENRVYPKSVGRKRVVKYKQAIFRKREWYIYTEGGGKRERTALITV